MGWILKRGNFSYDTNIHHTHEGSIGNLCTEEIKKQMQKVVDSFPFEKVNEAIKKLVT